MHTSRMSALFRSSKWPQPRPLSAHFLLLPINLHPVSAIVRDKLNGFGIYHPGMPARFKLHKYMLNGSQNVWFNILTQPRIVRLSTKCVPCLAEVQTSFTRLSESYMAEHVSNPWPVCMSRVHSGRTGGARSCSGSCHRPCSKCRIRGTNSIGMCGKRLHCKKINVRKGGANTCALA